MAGSGAATTPARRVTLAELTWRVAALEESRKEDRELRAEDRRHLDERFDKLERKFDDEKFLSKDTYETSKSYQDGKITGIQRVSTLTVTLMIGAWLVTLIALARTFGT